MNAQYTTTAPAFSLTATPATGVAYPLTDPSAIGSRPLGAFLQADTHDIRFTTDGSAPTSSVGMLLVAGAAPFFYAGALGDLRFIQVASGSKLNVIYVNDITVYLNLTVAALNAVMAQATITGSNLTLSGNLAAVGGVFSGAVSGTTGTFSDALVATSGTFSGAVVAPVVGVTQNSAPADGTIAVGECVIWFDKTNSEAKLMFKAKQADGTVKTGSINVQT